MCVLGFEKGADGEKGRTTIARRVQTRKTSRQAGKDAPFFQRERCAIFVATTLPTQQATSLKKKSNEHSKDGF